MGAICGVVFTGQGPGSSPGAPGASPGAVVDAMAHALTHRAEMPHRLEGDGYCAASSAPVEAGCLMDGTPREMDGQPLAVGRLRQACSKNDPLPLRGAFSAAVRLEDGSWRLLRDRLGRRPLYYYQGPDFLLFASELKALLATGLIERSLNLHGVDLFLTLQCVPDPQTILQDVYRVAPGHCIAYDDGAVTVRRWDAFRVEPAKCSRDEAVERIRRGLERALDLKLSGIEDASVLLWSSGIDCAALAALHPELRPVFVAIERGWQEREPHLSRESARAMNLDVQEEPARRFSEETFAKAVGFLEEPVADASVFPQWLIFEQIARHGRDAVSGHGADEVFGGYPRFHFLQKARGARDFVPVNQLSGLLPNLPPNAFVRRAGSYLASIHDQAGAYFSLASVFERDERKELYTEAMEGALHEQPDPSELVRAQFTSDDLTSNLLRLDLGVTLPDLLLFSCDRMAAAHGLTMHFPYLEDQLLDSVLSLPPEVRFGVRSKPLLRIAMKGRVPGRVRLRAQRRFHMPQHGRALRIIDRVARDVMSPERVDASGLFKWPYVETIIRSAGHNVYRRRQFWALLMFFAWRKEVMEA